MVYQTGLPGWGDPDVTEAMLGKGNRVPDDAARLLMLMLERAAEGNLSQAVVDPAVPIRVAISFESPTGKLLAR